jgi:hypothetical protein
MVMASRCAHIQADDMLLVIMDLALFIASGNWQYCSVMVASVKPGLW